MKMAKASKEDIQQLIQFFNMLEEVMEYGTYTPSDEESEQESIDVDAEKLCELITDHWNRDRRGVGTAWRRVVFGAQILIDNATDPAFDVLEWRPDIRAFLESQQEQSAAEATADADC